MQCSCMRCPQIYYRPYLSITTVIMLFFAMMLIWVSHTIGTQGSSVPTGTLIIAAGVV